MGCNCKSDEKEKEIVEINLKTAIPKYLIKFIGFLIMVLFLPIINIFIIWFIFQTLVLKKDVDVKLLLTNLLTKFKNKNDDDIDEEYEYELTNVEEINK